MTVAVAARSAPLWLGALALFSASASYAQAPSPSSYEDYLAELRTPKPSYVAVSNHFRHDESGECGELGCVLMGPTDDKDACERWVEAYNRVDPFDHARCVEQVAPAR
ncbi:MAG: hypothetical protein MRY74_16235 [Neomegalonema sp.]|nr:hypothetical protein [Neomegalonema sp.]